MVYKSNILVMLLVPKGYRLMCAKILIFIYDRTIIDISKMLVWYFILFNDTTALFILEFTFIICLGCYLFLSEVSIIKKITD